MQTLLVVAAEWFELKWIAKTVARRQDRKMLLVANGPGPKLAGEAVDSVRGMVDAIISTGLCGALDDSLEIGDIFVASNVNGMAARMPETSRTFKTGPLASVDRVVDSSQERRKLRETGALAVEMEAAAVCRRAAVLGIPFFCIRAVSDGVTENFRLDLNAARDKSGRFSIIRILEQTVRHPVGVIPELLRIKRNSELAARGLGDFVADCYF